MAHTNLPGGIAVVQKDLPGGDIALLNPLKCHIYFTDFDTYVAGDWTVTETDAGATQALTDADNGVLLITNTAADNDLVALNKVGESFKFVAGKKLYFEARFKISDATQSDFIVGLQIKDTTPLDVSDGVFFMKDDGDANLDFHVEKDNTATSATALSTVTSDTYLKVHFMYDGVSKVLYGKDDAWIGSLATTNLVDDEDLTISIAIQNGEGVAKTMSVDYIFCCKER